MRNFIIAILMIVSCSAMAQKGIVSGNLDWSVSLKCVQYNGRVEFCNSNTILILTQRINGGHKTIRLCVKEGSIPVVDRTWTESDSYILKLKQEDGTVAYVISESGEVILGAVYVSCLNGYCLSSNPYNSEEPEFSEMKILSGDFEISKPVGTYTLGDKYMEAKKGLTFHIKQNDYNSAGKIVSCWFEYNGDEIMKQNFSSKDVNVARIKKNNGYSYLIVTDDFFHAVITPGEDGKYIVKYETTER